MAGLGQISTEIGLRSMRATALDDHPIPTVLTSICVDAFALQQKLDCDPADGGHKKHMLSDNPCL